MDWIYKAKFAAVKLKHLSGWLNIIGWVEGSFLRCNYYHKYLACEEEDFCERYILFQGDWKLLSEERLVILLKVTRTWETKPAPKYTFFL